MKPTTKVALGLFAAWAVHDLEEVLTMSRTSKELLARLPKALPIPEELRREGVSQRHVNLAVSLMGAVMAAASAAGMRSGGRSAFFRGALLGFGMHGFSHLAMAAAARRYVPGVATAPTVVLPFWFWARRELAGQGITADDRAATAVALALVPLLPAVHVLAHRLRRG